MNITVKQFHRTRTERVLSRLALLISLANMIRAAHLLQRNSKVIAMQEQTALEDRARGQRIDATTEQINEKIRSMEVL